ncbi:hypothetical protein SAMN04487981_14017 [Streptomyces sp. cf386]|uniref:hypothetical protein n=1 Tax=Streptomyces sp. cf386 TaxID=1761904 RepID=UPI000889E4C1|nr:hypothetical protein [Streptomyces sp. cf386]SDP78106.1 hypothetical protein SAMN04487981_14017 [Streptomyces sp. cf386]
MAHGAGTYTYERATGSTGASFGGAPAADIMKSCSVAPLGNPGRRLGQVHFPERHLFDRRGTARGVRRLRRGQPHHRERWYRYKIPLAEQRYRDNTGDTRY